MEEKASNFALVGAWDFEGVEYVNKEILWEIYYRKMRILETFLLWGLLSSVVFYLNSKLVEELVLKAKST